MKKGTTSTGFEFEYDEQRLDDMRLVDELAVMLDEDSSEFAQIAGASKCLTLLLGPELKRRLYAHIGAVHEGRVPRAELQTALEEIMAAAGEDTEKNS